MSAIRSAEVVMCSPGRTFVTLRVTTEDGVEGLGDATLDGREYAVSSFLSDHVVPALIGRDAHAIEDTWQHLYREAYWRRGPVTMAAIAAVDVALWDIKAKVAGLPLYQLLGGASREGVLAYGQASGRDVPELLASIRERLALGYEAIGIAADFPERRADGGNDGEGPWGARSYLRQVPAVLEAVRAEFGIDLPLLHLAHQGLAPREAAKLAKVLEPYDLFWLEGCAPAEDPTALRYVRSQTTTPLATGELFSSAVDYHPVITERLIDFVRSGVSQSGGITRLKRLAEFAGLYGIKIGIHGFNDVSPVGMAAALHLDLTLHNFGIQEYTRHSDATLKVFRTSHGFKDGLLHPGDVPGLGVAIDDAAAARHPYVPAYSPSSRAAGGEGSDW